MNFTVRMELVFLSFNSSSELSTLPPPTTTMPLVEEHSQETMEWSVTPIHLSLYVCVGLVNVNVSSKLSNWHVHLFSAR